MFLLPWVCFVVGVGKGFGGVGYWGRLWLVLVGGLSASWFGWLTVGGGDVSPVSEVESKSHGGSCGRAMATEVVDGGQSGKCECWRDAAETIMAWVRSRGGSCGRAVAAEAVGGGGRRGGRVSGGERE